MRVCGVIVTYNRPELLVRCVAAVVSQTVKPDTILIVDNCSLVPAADVLREFSNDVQIFRSANNLGGAGGFCFGMSEGFRQGFDAVWLMDDDGVPSAPCLEKLIESAAKTKTGFLNPLVVDLDNHEELVFRLNVFGEELASREAAVAAANASGLIEHAINPFNGSLISREAYKKLGDIKFECFVWGDEEEYYERARAFKVPLATVVSALFFHPSARGALIRIGFRRSQVRSVPPERSHYYFRNFGFIKARYRGVAAAAYHGMTYLYFLLKSGRLAEAWKFTRYYADGVLNTYLLEPSRERLLQGRKQFTKVSLVNAPEHRF